MSQHSEERLPDAETPAAAPAGARILPFERPQSDLQRAIQERAQEALDRDRDRQRPKPQPLKWLVIFAMACIPVLLTFAAVDGFLRVFYRINETYNSAPAPAAQQPADESEAVPTSSEPGVVLLQPYGAQDPGPAAQRGAATSSATPPLEPPRPR
jgi:hypothetical protein